MDAFSYLSVSLAVIVGLAATQVPRGYRSLALARKQVRWYGLPLPRPADLGFQLIFLLLSLTAMVVRRQRFHEFLAVAMLFVLTAYIALLFARL
jgi:hypothetical protein